MRNKIIFTLVSALAVFFMLILFSTTSGVWDGACGYKQEFGLFGFYRAGSEEGPPSECASELLTIGFIQTILATITIVGSVYWCFK